MNWDAIGAVGEVIGAAAVVLTLAYLTFQVRASLKASRSQTLLDTSIQYQNLMLAPADNALIQSAFEKLENNEAMTSPERVALAGWCNAMMNFLEATWIQTGIGSFAGGKATASEYKGLVEVTRQFLETPGILEFLKSSDHTQIQKQELDRHYRELSSYLERASI